MAGANGSYRSVDDPVQSTRPTLHPSVRRGSRTCEGIHVIKEITPITYSTGGGACRLDPAATRTILSLPSTLSPSPSRDVGLEPLVAGQRPMTSS